MIDPRISGTLAEAPTTWEENEEISADYKLWGIDWLGFVPQDSTCNRPSRGEVAMKRKRLFRFSLGTLLAITGVWIIKKRYNSHAGQESSHGIGTSTMRVDDD